MQTNLSILYFAILSILHSTVVSAQEDAKKNVASENASSEATQETAPTKSDSAAAPPTDIDEILRAHQTAIDALVKENQKQQQETAELKAELEVATTERMDLTLSLMELNTQDAKKKFSVFGFMDTSFTAAFPNKKGEERNWNSPMFIITKRHPSFYQGNVNLIFNSEMSPSLEALVETRFTYQPSGNIESYPKVAYLNGIPAPPQDTYERTDTTVEDQYTGDFRLGGISIERAQFDWKPADWFKIRFGRYLSPYGIWHEDHGSTVRLTASMPFIISHNYMPNAQTGLMIFGHVFPSKVLDFEYAVTLSNGRGPLDEMYDLDRNKALGLRGKVNLSISDFNASVGHYLYVGQYTDSQDSLHVYLNATGTSFDTNEEQPVQWVETVTQKYDEIVISADLQMEYKGLQLYSEYVLGKIEYVVPTEIYELTPWLIGSATGEPSIEPNRISQAWYVIAAYELPLKKLIGDVRVTPFAGFDYLKPSDVYEVETALLIQAGLNIRPSAHVAIKSNAYCIFPKDETLLGGNHFWFWTNQIAVSF